MNFWTMLWFGLYLFSAIMYAVRETLRDIREYKVVAKIGGYTPRPVSFKECAFSLIAVALFMPLFLVLSLFDTTKEKEYEGY